MPFLIFLLPTPGSYFPNSTFCHFKYYLPFAEMHGSIWREMCKVEDVFLQLAMISPLINPMLIFFFLHFLMLSGGWHSYSFLTCFALSATTY